MGSSASPVNPITSTVPFEQDGKHHGFLRLPCSRDSSAWGSIMIPITVLRNGSGKTALLSGANHGDEYEGPIALQGLAHDLDPADISGRVIIVPYMNTPAFHAASRVSPLDGLNMNRCFPGAPDGTPTQKIADYFLHTLLPLADIALDFHSGGKTLDFIPFAAAHILDDADQQAACIEAMQAFNAPYSMILQEIDAVGMYDTAVEEAGKVFVSTEMGGGGSASALSARISRRGAENVLKHAGILHGEIERQDSVTIDTTGPHCFHLAETSGMLEMAVDLGERVECGDILARIWSSERTGAAPQVVTARMPGILAARHFPGLIKTGDCLAVLASVV